MFSMQVSLIGVPFTSRILSPMCREIKSLLTSSLFKKNFEFNPIFKQYSNNEVNKSHSYGFNIKLKIKTLLKMRKKLETMLGS